MRTPLPMVSRMILPALVSLIAFACFESIASAQGRGGGGPGGGGFSRGPMMGAGAGPGNNPRSMPPPNNSGSQQSTLRGGLQLGPPGRWWDDQGFAKTLNINPQQQHRMDEVFSASRGDLVKLYKNLQHQETELEKATRGKNPDEGQIFQQIDRVTQARADLEKANAHMLLEIRKEMTPEQIGRLEDHRVEAPPTSAQ